MKSLSRRGFLRTTALGLTAAGLAACTKTTANGVTTYTLNVAEVTADGNAALNITKTVLAFTGISPTVVAVADTGITGIQAALSAWNTFSQGKASITFDKNSVPAEFTSVITAIQNAATTVGNVVQSEAATLSTGLIAKIQAVSADVASVAAVLNSAIGTVADSVALNSRGETPVQWRCERVNALLARHGLRPIAAR
ncbi:hypothetical protein [Acetobacter ascendens]|uniref:Twin-arginine translocation signal domain-containing protein n=1 Tax=Acetobacter ascendens TaxID=481146 RepID=A0A1Y0UVX3_9PROT|nr:hypothetical protein [Acetobacter ascendens]ARW09925.1 hypothetical protein S101447_00823 [Acetobacter ascendens]